MTHDRWNRIAGVSVLWWLLAVALAVRLPTLGVWSVWIDEAFTLHDAQHGPPAYALYYWLTGIAARVLGTDEFALRVMPCAFGCATIVLLGAQGDGPADRTRYRLAALLLALAPWHTFWSQSARYYVAQAFLVVLAYVILVRRREGIPIRSVVAAGLCAVAAIGCHPSGFFVLPGLALVVFGRLVRRWRRWALLGLAAIAVIAAWVYAPLLGKHQRSKGDGSLWQLVTSYGFLAGPAMLLAAARGAVEELRQRRISLIAMAGLPFLGMAAVVSFTFVTGYHAFATFPFVVILASRGLCAAKGRWRVLLVGLVALELVAGQVLYHSSHGMRPRYRDACEAMAAAERDGMVLWASQVPPVAYYVRPLRDNLRTPPSPRFLSAETIVDLRAMCDSGQDVCVLVHPDDLDGWKHIKRMDLEAVFDGHLHLVGTWAESYGPKLLSLHLFATR